MVTISGNKLKQPSPDTEDLIKVNSDLQPIIFVGHYIQWTQGLMTQGLNDLGTRDQKTLGPRDLRT